MPLQPADKETSGQPSGEHLDGRSGAIATVPLRGWGWHLR